MSARPSDVQAASFKRDGGTGRTRDLIAKVLMIALGIATIAAFAGAAATFGGVSEDRIIAEGWRMLAFPVFAGIFFLLAFFPRRTPALWELVILQKAGITVLIALLAPSTVGLSQSDNAPVVMMVDGMLAVVTLTSYVLTKGWRAWGVCALA